MVSIADSQQEGPRLELHKVRAFLYSVYTFSQCVGVPSGTLVYPTIVTCTLGFLVSALKQGSGSDLELIPELMRYPPLPLDG